MGVDRTDYLVWGAKVNVKQVSWDAHIAELEGRPDARFDLIHDGMNGEYAVAGKIIYSADGCEGGEFTDVTEAVRSVDEAAIKAAVAGAFDTITPFGLFAFTHWH